MKCLESSEIRAIKKAIDNYMSTLEEEMSSKSEDDKELYQQRIDSAKKAKESVEKLVCEVVKGE